MVIWAPAVAPRDVVNVAHCFGLARKMLRHRPAMVISTGSGIAVGFLPVLAAGGVPAHYVESATRAVGPSLTGRILGKFPPVNMYTQHEQWASARWTYTGSVFEGFAAVPRSPLPERISKVVVTVGSLKFPFERMLQRVADLLPRDADVLWQVGSSDVREHRHRGPPDGAGRRAGRRHRRIRPGDRPCRDGQRPDRARGGSSARC